MAADIIIIGSGFGGSVLASRLVEAGKKVVVLERGPWRDTVPVRAAGIEARKPLPRTGGLLSVLRSVRAPKGPRRGIRLNKHGYLELWIGDGIKVPCTSNVGGGSHIWAALLERAPAGFWDDRAPGLGDDTLAPHYDRVTKELKGVDPFDLSAFPNNGDIEWSHDDCFVRTEAGEQPLMGILFPGPDGDLTAVTDENGIVREPLDFNRNNGMFGSPGASKSTVDALFLLPALESGLEVRDLHEARRISAVDSGGWAVEARDLRGGRNVTLEAPKLAVCAGTMNTNALMLGSRETGGLDGLPALGDRLGANGDLIGKWPAGGRDTTLGPPSFGRVKVKGHEDSAYFILGAGEPPPVPGFLARGARSKAGQSVELVGMTQDAADGRCWWENGRFRFAFDLAGSPSYAAAMRAMDAVSEASGRTVDYPRTEVFTAHPAGGCRIASDASEGVVDGEGQVHGHPGLYVADGSILPQPVGVPPSLSIAAWASHVAERIIRSN